MNLSDPKSALPLVLKALGAGASWGTPDQVGQVLDRLDLEAAQGFLGVAAFPKDS